MPIFENIVSRANKKGWSISELEKLSGLGNGTIGKWKTSKPSISSLEKVAEKLEVNVTTLLKG